MHFSDNEVHALLAYRFRGGTGSSDWLGLSLDLPADDMSANITEPVGGGYVRLQLPRTSDTWSPPADRAISTLDRYVWPTATADWGVVVAWVLFTAATGGSPVVAGRMNGTSISNGDTASLDVGAVSILAP